MQERNRLYEEVHGVVEGQSHQEELEFVAQRLFEFDYNFSTIRNKPAHDYNLGPVSRKCLRPRLLFRNRIPFFLLIPAALGYSVGIERRARGHNDA
jgi:hypothetical protein